MTSSQQFQLIVATHFLALLSPGPDFFLIARTALAHGRRAASGACLGVALANGLLIAVAFAGLAVLQPGSALFTTVQLAGAAYLLHLGWLFLRHAGTRPLQTPGSGPAPGAAAGSRWWRAFGMGMASALLNPKNALFYASLASLLGAAHASTGAKAFYGLWMFGVVLLWDLLVAAWIGHPAVLQRFGRALPWLERLAGAMLVLLALVVVLAAWRA